MDKTLKFKRIISPQNLVLALQCNFWLWKTDQASIKACKQTLQVSWKSAHAMRLFFWKGTGLSERLTISRKLVEMFIFCISYADISMCTSSHVANTNFKSLSTKGSQSWRYSHDNQWEYSVCFEEPKGCRTGECIDTQFKNKRPYFFWSDYKIYSSEALKIRNLERGTIKRLQMLDLKYKDTILPSQKPLCWLLRKLLARTVGVSDLIGFNIREIKERSW